MSNTIPRISIGMPVYNGERFLAEAVDSILSQTFEDFELIISDNASTDSTQEICRTYSEKDKRVRYYRNENNLGACRNFNRVFELSNGKYFKWAAADDLCAPDFLRHCVEVLDKEPEVILCYPKTQIIDEHGTVIERYEDGLNLISKSAGGRFLQLMHNIGLCNAVNGLIRSSVLRKTRLFNNYSGTDNVLLAELSLLGQFREIPYYMFFRRFHRNSSNSMKKNACYNYSGSYTGRGKDEQLKFINPKGENSIVLPHWRHLFEHLISLNRAPVKRSQKVLPLFFLFGGIIMNSRQYITELKTPVRNIFSRNHE